MAKSKLFNIRILSPIRRSILKDGEVTQSTVSAGVFNSNQLTITFAGAPILVTIIWKVVGLMFPVVLESYIFPVVLSLIIGMLIFWQSEPAGTTTKDKILGFTFALLNSFAIAATVLGINTATTGAALTGQ